MTKLTLVSSPTCPYVQRAIIALKEKAQDFDVIYVDLQNKPDWFLAISPLGKVPLLKVERPGEEPVILFESVVILEYLEETVDGVKLHPADPLEKARRRAWMEFGNTVLGDLGKAVRATDAAEQSKGAESLAKKLRQLDTQAAGPFFAGEAFSNVDAVFGPIFRQLDLIERVTGRALADSPAKVTAWRKALAARPSVRDAVPADYDERYLSRLQAMGAVVLKQAEAA